MLAIVLLGLIACESAASFKFRRVNQNYDDGLEIFNTDKYIHNVNILDKQMKNIIRREENLNSEIMDINRQQEELNRQMENIKKQKDGLQNKTEFLTRQKEQLERDMEKLNADIGRIHGQRQNYVRTIVEGNEFRITIFLSGYNEEDIVVKSKKGLLIVQASHNASGIPRNDYLNVRILPEYVEGSGRWLYKYGVLNIVFPIIENLNKYPKSTIPLVIDELSEKRNKKSNTYNQNSANNVTERFFMNSSTTNITENTDVPNLENEEKGSHVSNQGDDMESITDSSIEDNYIKAINKIASQKNSEEKNI